MQPAVAQLLRGRLGPPQVALQHVMRADDDLAHILAPGRQRAPGGIAHPPGWRASSTAAGWSRGTSDRHPPNLTKTLITDDSPNTWKNGSTASTTSSLRAPNSPPATVQFMYSWKWVSSAPFGLPVVPLV